MLEALFRLLFGLLLFVAPMVFLSINLLSLLFSMLP